MKSLLTLAVLLCSATAYAQEEYGQVSAAARVTFPGGTLAEHTQWKDVLSTGTGADVSYAHLWHFGPQCYLGGFASAGFDTFDGKRSAIIGGTIEPDGLDIFYLEAGPRFRLNLDNVFLDANIGFGAAFYQSADATISAGGLSAKVRALDSSTTFLFDAGGRIGVEVSKGVEIFLGVKWQMNDEPKVGSGLSGIHFEKMQDVVLDVGIQVNF